MLSLFRFPTIEILVQAGKSFQITICANPGSDIHFLWAGWNRTTMQNSPPGPSMHQEYFRKWIESAEGLDTLRMVTWNVRKFCLNEHYPPHIFGLSSWDEKYDEGVQADWGARRRNMVIDAIANELMERFLKKAEDLGRSMLAGCNPYYLLMDVSRKYVEEGARKKADWNFRYLYRRLVTVLKEAPPEFHTVGHDDYSEYSLEEGSAPIGPLAEEDLAEVPFPDAFAWLDWDSLLEKDNLRPLAVHFWKGIRDHREEERILIHHRDAARWIFANLAPGRQEAFDEGGLYEHCDDHNPERLAFDPEVVSRFVASAVDRLDAKGKAVLYYHYARGEKYDWVAKEMGYKGPSGPKNIEKKALETMGKLIGREGPSCLRPPDPVPEAMDLFLFTLYEVLAEAHSPKISAKSAPPVKNRNAIP
ncbi:MAG: hypothetical protein ABIM40_05315 [Pseudomonadota bacterium]